MNFEVGQASLERITGRGSSFVVGLQGFVRLNMAFGQEFRGAWFAWDWLNRQQVSHSMSLLPKTRECLLIFGVCSLLGRLVGAPQSSQIAGRIGSKRTKLSLINFQCL
jgi:hypothetical protein